MRLTLLLFATITTLLCLPLLGSTAPVSGLSSAVGFLSTALVTGALFTGLRLVTLRRALLSLIFWILLILAFLIRLTWFLVLDFSGEGFTHNFYVHVSVDALSIGLREYARLLTVLSVILLLCCFVISALGRWQSPLRPVHASPLIVACTAVLWILPTVKPEWQVVGNLIEFRQASAPGMLSESERETLEGSGLVTMERNGKGGLQATAPATPRNLILLFLESFHLAFTDEGPFPDLTPQINRLKREYGYHANWLSSADATMEGLMSSLCGTLISMPQGSSTFANTESVLPHLACLPDVLEEAGYYQEYLGGYNKNFSGKALFLENHGYDKVLGWEEWQQRGFTNKQGYWGLPDDQLFAQALPRVRELTAAGSEHPFNLTLLTLGTHPPGFALPSCNPYKKGQDSAITLEAIHCTDQLVGQFVEQLQAEGLLANTTLVITGDHDIFNLPYITEKFPDLAQDPRLLTIIIDPDTPFSYDGQLNAAYDLAPTVLELLNIEHNVEFIWGESTFDRSRDYVLTRNFRGESSQNLRFMDRAERECRVGDVSLNWPLDDCSHAALIRLSDKYLYSFLDHSLMRPQLCDEGHELHVKVADEDVHPSMKYFGRELAHSFADRGRPIAEGRNGFYLFIKESETRAAAFYFYRLDQIYWQMRLAETLIDLEAHEQFVLAYKPGEDIEAIEPLARLLTNYGFDGPFLQNPFIVASNGDPESGQIVSDRGEKSAALRLTTAQCQALGLPRSGNPVVEKAVIEELLIPYFARQPKI